MNERRFRRRKIREPHRFGRGLSIIPSLFTVGNIFCGCYSAISTLKGNYDNAALAIGVGYLLDGFDGRIARMTNTASEFGLELDSLADMITFGVAPALLGFSWGLGSIPGVQADIAKHVNQMGWLATFAFLLCGALRLARFNTQTRKPVESGSKRYFVGLPTPAAAGLIASVVHFFKTPITVVGSGLLWCFLMLLLSFLMVSTVRYYSFKEFDLKKRRPGLMFVAVGMLIGIIIFYSEIVLLAMAVIYALSGPVMKLVRLARRLAPSNDTSSEPAHDNIRN
jgi:CDP-diacylglycerol--serine O-phosphatidyltransferase